MNRRFFRILTVLLSTSLILVSGFRGTVSEASSTDNVAVTSGGDNSSSESSSSTGETSTTDKSQSTSEKLNEAVKEKEALEKSLKEAQALVSSLKDSKESTESKIKQLDSQLNTISAKLELLTIQLNELNTQIEDTTERLAETTALSEEQYASMKLRIQYIYENGSMNYLNIIFSAKDISSLLNAVEYVAMLSKYDRNMLQAYLDTMEYQEQLKEELETQYAEVTSMQEEITAQKKAVNVLRDAKATELTDIKSELTEAEAIAREWEAEVKAQNEILEQLKRALAAGAGADLVLGSSIFAWPCPSYTRISSDYGPRTSPTAGASSNHKGIDLAAPYGSDILAAESGKVTFAGYSSSAGNYIIISHGKDDNGDILSTVYMHCSALYVSEGDFVTRGQSIAAVGSTGVSTGNHLHFGVMKNGGYVSPWGYVSKP